MSRLIIEGSDFTITNEAGEVLDFSSSNVPTGDELYGFGPVPENISRDVFGGFQSGRTGIISEGNIVMKMPEGEYKCYFAPDSSYLYGRGFVCDQNGDVIDWCSGAIGADTDDMSATTLDVDGPAFIVIATDTGNANFVITKL